MNWEKTGPQQYELRQGDLVLANMKTMITSATCTIGSRLIRLERRGFWQSVLEMTDHNGQVLLRLEPANWFGTKSRFTWQTLPYEVNVRNAPLAEYFISQGGHDVLAYGLKTQQGKAVSVMTATDKMPADGATELHLLLWFLFHSVAEGETLGGIPTEAVVSVISA